MDEGRLLCGSAVYLTGIISVRAYVCVCVYVCVCFPGGSAGEESAYKAGDPDPM